MSIITDFIGDLPELEVLHLWENNFTGSIPRQLGKNGLLQLLDISSHKLTNNLPLDLCLSNKLYTLSALRNFLCGSIPKPLGRCASLGRIRMGKDYVNGSIPRGLFNHPNFTEVELQDNLLAGGLPDASKFKISSNLGQITLLDNCPYGPLPSVIGKFYPAQKLIINHLGRFRSINRAIKMFEKITKPDSAIGPDTIIFNNLINRLYKVGRTCEGRSLLNQIKFPLCDPNTINFNALILCKNGSIVEPSNLWASVMSKRNIEFVLNETEENGESKLIVYAYSSVIVGNVQMLYMKYADKGNPKAARRNVADDFGQLGVDDFHAKNDLIKTRATMDPRCKVFDPGGLIIISLSTFLPIKHLDGVELF